MKGHRRSLFGTLREPGIFNLRMSPLWLSSPMLFFSSLRATMLRSPQTYLGDHTLLIQTVFGHAMYLDTRDLSLTPHLFRQGYWEPDVTRFFPGLVKPGMRVAEIGANVGYYTILACSLAGPRGQVVAFEANPAAASLARKSIAVNGYRPRARIIDMAISDAPGTVTLHCLEQRQGDSSLFDFADSQLAFTGDRVTTIEVPATSLDAFLDHDEPIDLIRMDVEGSEPLVFDGMSRILERNPRLQVLLEFFPERIECSGRDPAKFLAFIRSLGFLVQRVGPRGRLQPFHQDMSGAPEFAELFLSR